MSEFPDPDETLEISVETVSALRKTGSFPFLLVDCREADELAICKIEGATHLPLSQFPDVGLAFAKGETEGTPVVVYCHHGMRSQHASLFLRQAGMLQTYSMIGGIEQWSSEIDPEVPRY